LVEKLFELDRGVIVACDLETINDLIKIVKATSDINGVVGYKIGFSLALKYSLPTIVDTIKTYSNLPIIYDHQKAGTDIPHMGPDFAKVCKDSGVKGVILFPQSGPETEKSFIDALVAENMIPLIGGEMTHPKYLEKEGGFIKNGAPEEMYLIAAKNRVEYFIVPGNKPERIKYYLDLLTKEIPIPKFCMPGIGRQGGDIKSAFKVCSDLPAYAIIGSGIYKAPNIRKAAESYCKEALELK